jgi:hypothetical protein
MMPDHRCWIDTVHPSAPSCHSEFLSDANNESNRRVSEIAMECQTKDELEQHLSDIRRLATSHGLTSEEREVAARAERFAIGLLKEHDASGHEGKRCPFATLI